MGGRQWSLRVRLLGTLAVVLLVVAAILTAVAWALLAVARGVVSGLSPAPSVVAGIVVLATLVVTLAHLRRGYRRTLERVDAQPAREPALTDRVTRLATLAKIKPPTLSIVDADEPTSFTVANGSERTIVLTTGTLETLDDAELEAVLAHEIAHCSNRDTMIATVVATIGSLTEALFARERRLGQWIQFLLTVGTVTPIMIALSIPILVLSVIALCLSVLARSVLAVTAVCIVLHAQAREYAADQVAADLVGDPAALASALETLSEGGPPTTDIRRLHASATLGIVPHELEARPAPSIDTAISRWIPGSDSELDRARVVDALAAAVARVGYALEWRPATHPPIEDRIARLRALA